MESILNGLFWICRIDRIEVTGLAIVLKDCSEGSSWSGTLNHERRSNMQFRLSSRLDIDGHVSSKNVETDLRDQLVRRA